MAYQVFISYKHTAINKNSVTRDYAIACDLYNTLRKMGVKVFFSEKDLSTSDYINKINAALAEADIMIVVGTKLEHIESNWVKEEWSAFIAEINGKRKPNGQVYTYLEELSPNELPTLLYKRQSFTTKQKDTLISTITEQLGIKPAPVRKPRPQKVQGSRSASPAVPQFAQVGNILQFGQYPQGADGKKQPLSWRVLDVKNGRALLISEKLIDCVKYNETQIDVTWETCTLREWMNSDFINKAFSKDQQAQILTVQNSNPNNPKKQTTGGNSTEDKLFLLTINDANKYFKNDNDRMAAVTEYAEKKKCLSSNSFSLPNGEKTGWWWLRSPGERSTYAARVTENGQIGVFGSYVNRGGGSVRPAFWLKIPQTS